MRIFRSTIILIFLLCLSGTICGAAWSQDSPQISQPQSFQDSELPRRFTKKLEGRRSADLALADWIERKYDSCIANCKQVNQIMKLKGEELNQLQATAQTKMNEGDNAKAIVLNLIAYEAIRSTGRATADEVIPMAYKLAIQLGATGSDDGQRAIASSMLASALQIRTIAGGIRDSDAPYVLEYARLEFMLRRWENVEKQYLYWLSMYENKGRNPPAQDLPDALAQLAISYNHRKNVAKSEEYFSRAVQAAQAYDGSTITPINHYDVEEFYIYALVGQHKLALAHDLTVEHLKERERKLGLNSPELAKVLTNYANMFEEAGEVGFAFSLRSRAGKIGSQ